MGQSPQTPVRGLLSPRGVLGPSSLFGREQRCTTARSPFERRFPSFPLLWKTFIYQPAKGRRNLFQVGCVFPSARNNISSCV